MSNQTMSLPLSSFITNSENLVNTSSQTLQDQTAFMRAGVRGPQAEFFLSGLGIEVPCTPNSAIKTDTGEWILKLSKNEFWFLAPSLEGSPLITEMLEKSKEAEGVYQLFCQHSHCQFSLAGKQLSTMMAKVCGVDLRPEKFSVGAIAQTSVARVNAIVVRTEADENEGFIVLSDVTSSEYLFGAILDAMQEF